MLDHTSLRLARLRDRLPAQSPGARGRERLARNSSCNRLRALTLSGITPAAAAQVYRDPAPEGQSPFALGAGNRVEQQLFDDGATRSPPCTAKPAGSAPRKPPSPCSTASCPARHPPSWPAAASSR